METPENVHVECHIGLHAGKTEKFGRDMYEGVCKITQDDEVVARFRTPNAYRSEAAARVMIERIAKGMLPLFFPS